jgi:hypothetical protein
MLETPNLNLEPTNSEYIIKEPHEESNFLITEADAKKSSAFKRLKTAKARTNSLHNLMPDYQMKCIMSNKSLARKSSHKISENMSSHKSDNSNSHFILENLPGESTKRKLNNDLVYNLDLQKVNFNVSILKRSRTRRNSTKRNFTTVNSSYYGC